MNKEMNEGKIVGINLKIEEWRKDGRKEGAMKGGN